MNEQEAMEIIFAKAQCEAKEDNCDKNGCDNCELLYMQGTVKEHKEALGIGIKALEEIQQYRELGTVEELREAMEMKQKYETQWIDDINNPLEPLKLSSALRSEIFKLEYRKANKPKEINILDYTVIYALKDCLERYSGIREE